MFEGFVHRVIDVDDLDFNLVMGGSGPPILLLHGYPQTHVCWHRVAPLLAERFTVICPDLRGYGDSAKPHGDPEHRTYSKRAMARDEATIMAELGFERFAVVGHDRGARVARRMALDYPELITHVAILDIVPTDTIYATLDRRRATDVWRYFFLIQPFDLPERLIGSTADFYLRWTLNHWCGTDGALTAEAVSEYLRCFDEAGIHATCEDYRAGATADLNDDASDAGRRIRCDLLVLWSQRNLGALYDVAACWKGLAEANFHTMPLDCGHFLPEERPEEVASAISDFVG